MICHNILIICFLSFFHSFLACSRRYEHKLNLALTFTLKFIYWFSLYELVRILLLVSFFQLYFCSVANLKSINWQDFVFCAAFFGFNNYLHEKNEEKNVVRFLMQNISNTTLWILTVLISFLFLLFFFFSLIHNLTFIHFYLLSIGVARCLFIA